MDLIKQLVANPDNRSVVGRFVKTFMYSFLGSYITLVSSSTEIHWGVLVASSLLAALGFSTHKALSIASSK